MVRKATNKEQRYYNGIPIDSNEEAYTIMWLEELIQHGYIERIERAGTFTLSEPIVNEYTHKAVLKTKTKDVAKKQKILHGHVYTPEFKLYFTQKGITALVDLIEDETKGELTKLFIGHYEQGQIVAYVEIKPEYDQNNMERLFKINRAWMMDKYGIYINLIKPLQLFEKTFTPAKYLITSTGKKRVVHIEVRGFDEWERSIS